MTSPEPHRPPRVLGERLEVTVDHDVRPEPDRVQRCGLRLAASGGLLANPHAQLPDGRGADQEQRSRVGEGERVAVQPAVGRCHRTATRVVEPDEAHLLPQDVGEPAVRLLTGRGGAVEPREPDRDVGRPGRHRHVHGRSSAGAKRQAVLVVRCGVHRKQRVPLPRGQHPARGVDHHPSPVTAQSPRFDGRGRHVQAGQRLDRVDAHAGHVLGHDGTLPSPRPGAGCHLCPEHLEGGRSAGTIVEAPPPSS